VKLDKVELLDINGGAPSKDTSLGYDIGYFLVTALMAIGKGASAIKG
jgi:hypothetical protein